MNTVDKHYIDNEVCNMTAAMNIMHSRATEQLMRNLLKKTSSKCFHKVYTQWPDFLAPKIGKLRMAYSVQLKEVHRAEQLTHLKLQSFLQRAITLKHPRGRTSPAC